LTLLLVTFGVQNSNRFSTFARRTRVLIGNTIRSGILRNHPVIAFSEMNKKGPLKAWAD